MKTRDHNKRTFARRAAMTLLAAVMTTMAWAQDPATIGSIRYNAALGAYEICSVENLNDLAVYVSGIGQYKNSDNKYTYSDGTQANGEHTCAGMTFKMTADITFPHKAAGEEGADTDNFTPIGKYNQTDDKPFCGHFDGYDPTDNSSHTISGIRIYSNSNSTGLFGILGYGALVEGVTLTDAVISGNNRVGGIVGNNKGGTVTHCTVTKSVAIYGSNNYLGGIAGSNHRDDNKNTGSISHCTSSAQIGFLPGASNCRYLGGVVGGNTYGSLTDNIAIEVTVPKSSNNNHGAIAGDNDATIARNYYRHCTVAGVVNAIGKGIYNNDFDGALPLFSLTVPTGVTATTVTQPIRIADEDDLYPSGTVFTLSGGLDDLDDPDDDGYMKGYTTTAGTVVGSTTSGFTLTLRGGDATVGTTSRFVIDWADESTGDDADHAYLIYNAEQLDLVARRVNDDDTRSTYKGKYYRLMKDINYSTANTDNNYTPIGRQYYPFQGHFDGGGHFVSGIRINRPNDSCLGLFGTINDGSTVSNVIVRDACITGSSHVGCIAGYAGNNILTANYYHLCSCTVGDAATAIPATTGIGCNGADITDNDGAVPVFYILNYYDSGITIQPDPIFTVGYRGYYKPGTVITLSGQPSDTPVNQYYKYCVGGQDIDGNSFIMPTYDVDVNFAISPTDLTCVNLAPGITATPSPLKSNGVLNYYMPGTTITLSGGLPEAQEGYYYAYTVNDEVIIGNSFDVPSFIIIPIVTVGVSSDPIFDPDMLVLYDDQDNSEAIAAAYQSNKTYNVRLSGHTLYKDGRWNPLCLPFNVELEGSPLEGATVTKLEDNNCPESRNKVVMQFNAVSRMEAGIPYLVRWEESEGTETEMTSPLFRQVHISTTQPKASGDIHSETSKAVTFTGNYSPVTFTSAFKNVLFNDEGSTLGAFRAYLKIDSNEDLLAPPEPDHVFVGWGVDGENSPTYITDIAELNIDNEGVAILFLLWGTLGDVNGDYSITPADAIMILYHYFGVAQKGFFKAVADINGDSTISPADAIEALYKYFGVSAGARSSSPANPRDPD